MRLAYSTLCASTIQGAYEQPAFFIGRTRVCCEPRAQGKRARTHRVFKVDRPLRALEQHAALQLGAVGAPHARLVVVLHRRQRMLARHVPALQPQGQEGFDWNACRTVRCVRSRYDGEVDMELNDAGCGGSCPWRQHAQLNAIKSQGLYSLKC